MTSHEAMRRAGIRVVAFFCALSLFLVGCPRPVPPPHPPTPDAADASAPDSGPPRPATCTSACARQAQLGCQLAQPTAEGSTCVEVCTNTLDGLQLFRWNIECLATATACDTCVRR